MYETANGSLCVKDASKQSNLTLDSVPQHPLMLEFIYYSILNLCYYHKQRQIPHRMGNRMLLDIAACKGENALEQMRKAITNAFLATAGLRIVDNDADTIPWYMPLSAAQRSWIKHVSKDGYKVGLLLTAEDRTHRDTR